VNYAHLHIVLNHFPTIGSVIGIGLFVGALVGRGVELMRASLVVLVVMALLAMPTFITGSAARMALGERPGLSDAMVGRHQDAAVVATGLLSLTGGVAWLGLWQLRRFSRVPRRTTATILALSLFTVAAMTRTGTLGGEISHVEIRAGGDAEAAADPPRLANVIGSFVVDRQWAWPAIETLHFVGMAVIFGVALLLNLRVLGFMKAVPFPALHRLLPLGVLAFGVNFVTGMMFVIANGSQYVLVPAFHWKIGCIVLGGMSLLYFTACDDVWTVAAGRNAPLSAKVLALSALGLLFAALYFGRMLPYLEVV
jgi:uncharacterized membrane protein